MENTNQNVSALLSQAKENLKKNMLDRNMAAIIWDLSSAGFHYIPSVTLENGKVLRVTGLYVSGDQLYLIDEECKRANIDNFYDPDTEVRPTVVCLTPNVAPGDLGAPSEEDGFTQAGSLEEWMVVADCYFEALNEESPYKD